MPLLNSAILALGATAIAWPIGSLLAVALTKFAIGRRRVAVAALGVLLFLPLYLHLAAWEAALGKLGWHTLLFGSLAEPLLAGMRGAIFIHGVAAIPWVAAIVGVGLLQVDPAQEEAALLVGSPLSVLRRITLPQSRPFLAAAALWTIVSTAADMTVTNIYLVDPREQTYTERFYMALALSGQMSHAASQVIPGVVGLALLIGCAAWIVARLNRHATALRTLRRPRTLGRLNAAAATAVWIAIALLVAVPLASLFIKAGFVVVHGDGHRTAAWSLLACAREVASAPRRFASEIWGTLYVASGAACLALISAALLGWLARRGGWKSIFATAAIVLGLSIPGPLIGAALIQILNHDVPPRLAFGSGPPQSWLLILYDHTALAPVLAQAIRALPLATLLAWHSFATLNPHVLEAAALDSLSPLKVFLRIGLAQRRRALAAAWLAAFAIAAGDLAWAHLVTPPGLDLLQRRVFGLIHSGVEEQVAAIGLLTVATYSVLATAIILLLKPRAST